MSIIQCWLMGCKERLVINWWERVTKMWEISHRKESSTMKLGGEKVGACVQGAERWPDALEWNLSSQREGGKTEKLGERATEIYGRCGKNLWSVNGRSWHAAKLHRELREWRLGKSPKISKNWWLYIVARIVPKRCSKMKEYLRCSFQCLKGG